MIKIFYTSDIHGYIYPYKYHDNQERAFGLAKVSAYIKDNYDENSIYLDNGDVLEGSQLLDYYYQSDEMANPIKTAFNHTLLDYVNLGNHDFNYGLKNLNDYLTGFNCLTSNISLNGLPFGKSVIHKFKNGIKIGIIGVCTQHLINWEKPENLVGVELKDAFETLKDEVDKIKDQVDYVVGIYHGGFERDLITGKPTDVLNGENEAYQMCQEIAGLDILLTGHQHRVIEGEVNGVKVLQPGMGGEYLGEIIIDDGKINARLIKPDNLVDQTITSKLKAIEDKTQKWLDQAIVTLKEDLLIKDEFEARLRKHKLVSLLNQIQLHYSGADFSAVALFNDAVGFSKNLTMRELTSTYVYPNTLVVLKTDVTNLKLFLEKCAEYFTLENGEIVVDPDFYVTKKQHYNYDMVDGLSYTIKVSNPRGSRIINLQKDGQDLDINKTYTIVMNNYRAAGGGDFEMTKNMQVVKNIEESMVHMIYDYLTKHQDLVINHKDNIKVII